MKEKKAQDEDMEICAFCGQISLACDTGTLTFINQIQSFYSPCGFAKSRGWYFL